VKDGLRRRGQEPLIGPTQSEVQPRHRWDLDREWDGETAETAQVLTVTSHGGQRQKNGQVVRRVPEDPLFELPAWPVLCLLWGLPLWWLAGLFSFSSVVLAPVMLFYLTRRRHVWLAPGIMPFLALAVWIALGILVVDHSNIVAWRCTALPRSFSCTSSTRPTS
jgi:hypothetical protein